MTRQYKITPGLISRVLLSIVLLLLLANLFCVFASTYFDFSFHTMDQFYFNTEGNLPTLFSFALLVTSSVILWIIGEMATEIQRRKHMYWKIISVIFLFIALDELISIHETFSDNMRAMLGGSGRDYLYFAWVIPYTIVFAVILILLLRFFISLPTQTKSLFTISACTYLIGAVGLEMIAGNYVYDGGAGAKQTLPYMLMVTIEELLEMIGLVIFINALVRYYVANHPDKSVVFTFKLDDQK